MLGRFGAYTLAQLYLANDLTTCTADVSRV